MSVLVFHGVVSAQAQRPTQSCQAAGPYITSAQAALATGDSTTALQGLRRAVETDPSCAEAYLLLGLTEFKAGAAADSIRHYKRALELQPASYSAHYNLALAYLREHRLQDGRMQLEQAVRLDPNQADAVYDLGVVLLDLGQPAEALPHLTSAQKLNPQRPDVAFNLVRAELEAGHTAEARSQAEAASKDFGTDFQWCAGVGQLFLKNSEPADAAVYLGKANQMRPDAVEIRHQLAEAYLASGQLAQVLNVIPEAKTYQDHYLRGSALYLDHRFEDADQESQAAIALAPDDPQVLVLRVRLLQRAGEQNAAVELALKAASLANNWYEPYYLAGVSLYFIRRYAEASQNLARAAELNPRSSQALFLEAIALASQGKQEEAEKWLRRAIAVQPNNARLYCHLGILLGRENEPAQAEESLRKSIELNPNNALSHYELGKLLVQSQRWKESAEELQQAIHFDPGLSAAYYQLARVYARLGETEKSQSMLADFKKLYQAEKSDSQVQEDDARKETE